MGFLFFIAKRTLYSLAVLFGLSLLVFFMARVMPGDPARLALGQRTPEEAIERFREEMHLNDSFFLQYYHWLKGLLHGDLGVSFVTRRPILDEIKAVLPATMELILFALLINVIIGQTMGITAAWHRNTWIDNAARGFSYIGVVIPSFIVLLFLILIFCYLFPILPTTGRLSYGVTPPPVLTGMMTVDSLLAGHFEALLDTLKHMILPALALAIPSIAQGSRITRASMIDFRQSDWLAFERASGIPERTVMFKYLLRPALVPTVSVLGPGFAYMVVNGFLVESISGWPGLARYGMTSILEKDLNALTAVVLILGVFFAVMNTIVDIVVGWLNPNMRLAGARRK